MGQNFSTYKYNKCYFFVYNINEKTYNISKITVDNISKIAYNIIKLKERTQNENHKTRKKNL